MKKTWIHSFEGFFVNFCVFVYVLGVWMSVGLGRCFNWDKTERVDEAEVE